MYHDTTTSYHHHLLSSPHPHHNGSTNSVMLSILNFLFLFIHLSIFLLTKLFQFLHHDDIFQKDFVQCVRDDHEKEELEKEDLIADILGGETLCFLRKGKNYDESLFFEQGEDSKEDVVSLKEDYDTEYDSPLEDLPCENNDVEDQDKVLESKEEKDVEDTITTGQDKVLESKEGKDVEDTIVTSPHLLLEKVHGQEVQENKDIFGGSLTGEEYSTSKSSVEWRSSTIFRDSETDHSSSRKSSSRWESYALFRKYDEEMLFFDRISSQKLAETESLRSIKVNPRSISERIVHKLSTTPMNLTQPYQELESAYVAQICLTWEALNWNYTKFQEKNTGCPARIAQQFQQFLVLLQRFIENEPYEYGRRPEVYARRRISSPKLLQVPEFKDFEGEEGMEDTSTNISTEEFVVILEDAIRTFMEFLKADKEKCSEKVRAFMRRKAISADPIFHRFLIKANKKKKSKLVDIGKRQTRCIRKRKMKHKEEMDLLMSLIDLKVVSRVLRMASINNEELHWCEEKMSKVRVSDDKMQRDSSPLFFPVH